ncbi:energy-coupling factor transporter transmembrane protein EcfT [Spiroplasma endosymbiont of Anurida maritima]|uniref:energy-coupling factor transporter transmembrane component T family protein n=1 Tax=Spiroplasma endosymbiont of Anurida maritima TaxID=2967972 RepID=UPI0036D2DD61
MRLSLGRYIDHNSPIHKMDPRLKLFMFITLMVTIFLQTGFTGYAIIGTFIFSIYFIARLGFRTIISLLKPLIFMFIILFIINSFLLTDGTLGWHWGGKPTAVGESLGGPEWFSVSEKSLYSSLYMAVRIFLMITITTILTSTTQPLDLTIGLEDLLTPLKLIKFPVHIFSTIISIALRMIPTLIDEAGRIMKAQASRGVDFKNGKLKDKVKSTTSLIIPLLVSSFQKAEDLAYAMDARGYDPHAKRTRYRKYSFRFTDWLIFLVGITFASAIFAQSITFGEYTTFYQIGGFQNGQYVYDYFKTGILQIRIPRMDDFLLG